MEGVEGADQTPSAVVNSDAGNGAEAVGMMEAEKGRHILPFKGTTWKWYILLLLMFRSTST